MAQDRFEQFQIPNEMRSLAEQSMAQARKVFDDFADMARKTAENLQSQAETTRTGSRDVTRKAMGFAAQNVSASLEFAQKLVQAKNPAEVMQLQKDYLDRQMRALSEQAEALGQGAAEMAKEHYKSES
jgi:phasin